MEFLLIALGLFLAGFGFGFNFGGDYKNKTVALIITAIGFILLFLGLCIGLSKIVN